jgi:hypothetical protein
MFGWFGLPVTAIDLFLGQAYVVYHILTDIPIYIIEYCCSAFLSVAFWIYNILNSHGERLSLIYVFGNVSRELGEEQRHH